MEERQPFYLRARSAFEKAIQFAPGSTHYRNLARVHQVLGDRKQALTSIQQSLVLDPNSVDSLKLLDDIKTMPNTEFVEPTYGDTTPPRNPLSLTAKLFIAGVIVFLVGAALAPTGSGFAPLLILAGLFIGGLALYFWYSEWNSYWEYKRARQRGDMNALRDELYEHRYRAERDRE
jgi:tetratricopeptide (TPR) repeat protein